jgi:hypothetical protein
MADGQAEGPAASLRSALGGTRASAAEEADGAAKGTVASAVAVASVERRLPSFVQLAVGIPHATVIAVVPTTSALRAVERGIVPLLGAHRRASLSGRSAFLHRACLEDTLR